MVIKHVLLAALSFYSALLLAQTTLSTSFDFVTSPATMPTGWTTNTTANYSTGLQDLSGGTSRAGKLQSTNHQVEIHFYDEPGSVSYYIKSFGTSSFMGTFLVEESEDGSNWNTVTTYSSNSFGSSWTQYTSTPDVDSRYIRFRLSNKVSGTNVGLDNVEITENITSEQEMNIVFNGNNVPNSTGISFAEALSTTFEVKLGIENLGTANALIIGSATISGTASSDYSITTNPSSIGSGNSDTLIIEFTPSAQGNRIGHISIPNNDANEDPYVINLNGVGGLSASEPTENPGSASTSYLRTWRVNGTFENIGSDGYLTLIRKGQAVTDAPIDGVVYSLGEGIGTSKVVGIGPNPSYRIRSAEAETVYHISVFAYNGSGSLINYRTNDPLETTITTPIASMDDPSYWQGIDENSTSFVSDINDLINDHQVRFYSNYDEDMIPGLYGRDTSAAQESIAGVYSSEIVVYTPPFDWSSTNMNREHTFPVSWMPSVGNSGTPEYQDLHHLFPTIATANSQRSNRPLGNVSNVTSSYGDGKAGTDANGNSVYEPRDAQKGDAARAIMYMMTAYGWNQGQLQANGPNQKFGVLLQWHLNDLPSEFERSRNDYVDSLQGNRNPFVDSAHWACYIDFKNKAYILEPDTNCLKAAGIYISVPTDTVADSTTSMGPKIESFPNWSIGPIPTNDVVQFATESNNLYHYRVLNIDGSVVLRGYIQNGDLIQVGQLSTGTYIVEISEDSNSKQFKQIFVSH